MSLAHDRDTHNDTVDECAVIQQRKAFSNKEQTLERSDQCTITCLESVDGACILNENLIRQHDAA